MFAYLQVITCSEYLSLRIALPMVSPFRRIPEPGDRQRGEPGPPRRELGSPGGAVSQELRQEVPEPRAGLQNARARMKESPTRVAPQENVAVVRLSDTLPA